MLILICNILIFGYFYQMNIQGKLIIIGGAVDKGSFTETELDKNATINLNFFETGILKRILVESKYKELSRIEIITTASKVPKEIGPEYVKKNIYLIKLYCFNCDATMFVFLFLNCCNYFVHN